MLEDIYIHTCYTHMSYVMVITIKATFSLLTEAKAEDSNVKQKQTKL